MGQTKDKSTKNNGVLPVFRAPRRMEALMKKKWYRLVALVAALLFVVSAPTHTGAAQVVFADTSDKPVWRVMTDEKLIALTFDDGPHRVYTKKLLDGLHERGVKASFFLVGENIQGNEELVRQMAKDGHLIGVHCMAHVDLAHQPIEKSVEEIRETYLPMGFSNFKIEGRGLGSALILEFLLHYLTKPEHQLEVREDLYLDNMLDRL